MYSLPLLNQLDKPKYLQLADALRSAIRQGQLQPGERLVSARSLAESLTLNRHTVMNALQLLVAEGWLASQERSGYVVEASLPIESSRGSASMPQFNPIVPTFAQPLSLPKAPPHLSYDYHFGGGLPDLQLFPYSSFRRMLAEACLHRELGHFHYSEVAGVNALQLQVLAYLRRARALNYQEVLICNGSQEALYLVAKAFLREGDEVAMENLGYPPAKKAFASFGARLRGIPQDEQGICTQALKNVLSEGKVRLLYLTPLHQYPTTVTLSPARRLEVYQLCYQHGVFIVEDDYDHEFHYACQPLRPLAADDPAGIVIYLSTFSKLMFAGARTGYICASEHVLPQLVALKQLLNHKNDAVMQLAIAKWMAKGEFERHLRKMTKLYHARRDAMVNELGQWQRQGKIKQFTIPDGGMALWVDSGIDVRGLAQQAAKLGVFIQTEEEFLLAPEHLPTHIRLGFAGQSSERAKQGLAQLMTLL
ncbi:PLP-dependent aminotransferase family protein [Pseudoalteromonas fenneropenaei]|uniref:PLP-dependent aminotransferase family protein n=1 Tax=Pseudoalteromonas fenneropenaei TaxID=1737459 RepID=A0ABV7CG60_9GAMM